ncbi:sensor domain-containing protein [Clostridium sp. ZS2-4]|uniref:sensor domain-containing protein n=1 Tax=Clostridium sp. ZS2-4 TaxID=2987703 RepID=UPI00227BF234|nr:EAL domain-containing protein [Clostridium sp. ZS2-4]MCY6353745.1 EAL domain-containing protein [Clostridium sp. ZS2-4]
MKNIKNSEALKLFIENLPELAFVKDRDTRALYLSREFENLLKEPLKNIIGKTNEEIWQKEVACEMTKNDLEVFKLSNGQYLTTEEEIYIYGKKLIYKGYKFPIEFDDKEKLIGGIIVDITETKEKEKKLRESYEALSAIYDDLTATEKELRIKYNKLQENEELLRKNEERYELASVASKDGMYDWDTKNDTMFYSKTWKKIIGYDENELIDICEILEKSIYPEDRKTVLSIRNKYLNREIDKYNIEYRFRKKDGSYIWIQDSAIAMWDNEGKPVRVVGTYTDIDKRIKREKTIFNMAYYDSLTGLPNRRCFEKILKKALEFSRNSNKASKGIVLFLDLDNFKNINDTLGHDIGDKLLEIIANRLKEVIRKEDTISRFGGDEFLILQPDINTYEEAVESANKIIDIFKDLWILGEHKLYITPSIGITVYPDDGEDVNIILRNVDTAAYDAKFSGKNRYTFFKKSMFDQVLRKTEIEKALREAVKNDEFELYYQPQIEVSTGRIVSLEALIRWTNPELGFISPMEFIPIAEETGLIVDIGEWVIRTACKQNKEWKNKDYFYDTIAVNVSSLQLRQRGFVDLVKNILTETGLKPEFLELEITESVLMESLEKSIEILNELRKIGVKTALDDFGTGYSSLNYLINIPIDTLKIDKTFIDDVCTNYSQKSIIEGIIIIAHEMALDVVAEGVEIQEQLKILADKKCDKIQGYFFSKPYEANEIEKILQKGFFTVSI